jgi:hypothetical protein
MAVLNPPIPPPTITALGAIVTPSTGVEEILQA